MAYIEQIQFIKYSEMTTKDEVDNITKNIVGEISRECKKRDVNVEEKSCIYFVQLQTLNPLWKITPGCQINRENITKLVNLCIEEFKKGSPYVKNIISQHFFMSGFATKKDIINEHRNAVKEKIKPLKDVILDFKMDEISIEGRQKLLKKIIMYIILNSGFGHPGDPEIINEVSYALGSILNDKEIVSFCELPINEKEKELENFNDLVTGIRIFNEKTHKTYSVIQDFLDKLQDSIFMTLNVLRKFLSNMMERIYLLTMAVENCYELNVSSTGLFRLSKNESIEVHYDYIALLIVFRQQELFLRKLLYEAEKIQEKITNLIEKRLHKSVTRLAKTVGHCNHLAACDVYPSFLELSDIIYQIQDEAIVLKEVNRIFSGLVNLTQDIVYDHSFFKNLFKGQTIITDEMRLTKNYGLKVKISKKNKNLMCLYHHSDLVGIRLEYLGFCPWTIVETNGGLVPGDQNLGILKWKRAQKYYIFSCKEAAEAFSENPEKYTLQILDLARVKTDLIHLLQLYDELLLLRNEPMLYIEPIVALETHDVGVQTELHPIETNIVKDYMWNKWDIYRDAIYKANITNCVTHSTQTHQSHLKSSIKVQTIEYRNKIMQTKKDNYTNVPTLSTILYGLKNKDVMPHMVILTRPINE